MSCSLRLCRAIALACAVLARSRVILSLLAIFPLLGFTVFCAPEAAAEQFHWEIDNPSPRPLGPDYWYADDGGKIIHMESDFDSSTNRLRLRALLAPDDTLPYVPPGADPLPNGYSIVLNNGPMPWTVGLAAALHFDASDTAHPTLTAYAYNASHSLIDDSWMDGNGGLAGNQSPDLLCTSRLSPSCGAWVHSLTVSDSPAGREFYFDIDVSEILAHVPVYSSGGAWYGAGFDSHIGLWFHPFVGASYNYNNAGYINALSVGLAGYYDAQSLQTNILPRCTSTLTQTSFRPGESATFVITGIDPDGTLPQIETEFPGLGDGFSCSISNGPTPSDGVRLNCTFTAPPVSTPTSYLVRARFTDQGGESVTCQETLEVQNHAPTCLLGGQYTNLACEGTITTVEVNTQAVGDLDQDPISRTFTIHCSSGTSSIDQTNPTQAVISLSGPGAGVSTTCDLTLSVSDGFVTSECSACIEVDPCRLDCAAVPLGKQVIDQCGVCGGANKCLDCSGVPFGTATLDRCNICKGDGQSCLGCHESSNLVVQQTLDSQAGRFLNFIKQGASIHRRAVGGGVRGREFRQRILGDAKSAYLKSWKAIWSVPVVVNQCDNTQFCVTVSSEEAYSDFTASISQLHALLTEIAQSLRIKSPRRSRRLLEQNATLLAQVSQDETKLQKETQVCN